MTNDLQTELEQIADLLIEDELTLPFKSERVQNIALIESVRFGFMPSEMTSEWDEVDVARASAQALIQHGFALALLFHKNGNL